MHDNDAALELYELPRSAIRQVEGKRLKAVLGHVLDKCGAAIMRAREAL